MKLGFYLESILIKDNDNTVYSNDTYFLILPKLIRDGLTLHITSRLQPFEATLAHYRLDDRIKFTPLSDYSNIFDLLKRYPKYIRQNLEVINNFLGTVDHLVLATGGPLSLFFLRKALAKNIPCTILVRANARKTIPTRFTGVKRVLATLFTNYIESRIDKLCEKHNLGVIALGDELYQHYGKLTSKCISFASSKFTKNDIVKADQLRPLDTEHKIKFLFVGRLVVNKGLNELITALSKFNEYSWHLDIVGDGEYRNSVETLIAKFNLGAKITLLGSIPFSNELIEIYREHDVVILPSYCEGLPQVVLEGMANGCLVMATNVGGVPKVINHLSNGLLFEPQSSDEITKVLSLLTKTNSLDIKNNALVTALGYAQENQIENFFNVLK